MNQSRTVNRMWMDYKAWGCTLRVRLNRGRWYESGTSVAEPPTRAPGSRSALFTEHTVHSRQLPQTSHNKLLFTIASSSTAR